MAFVSIFDETDELDAVMFPLVYQNYKNKIAVNKLFLGTGNVEERNGKLQYIINIFNEIK
jgi:DNA polymerase-3 subunit alpha